jgi:hypothetical protein
MPPYNTTGELFRWFNHHKQTNSLAFSPQSKYTYRPTAACRQSYHQLLRVERYRVVSAADPHGHWSQFSRTEPLLFIHVAVQLSSRGWVDPVPQPLLLAKSGSAGNRTQDLWICSWEHWSLYHRGGHLITTQFLCNLNFLAMEYFFTVVYINIPTECNFQNIFPLLMYGCTKNEAWQAVTMQFACIVLHL